MLGRWVRLVVAFAVALLAWLVATPAHAAAPLCDPRGATVMAPAPQLQEPTTSIDVGTPVNDDDCSASAQAARTANDGTPQLPAAPDAATDSVLPTAAPEVADPPFLAERPSRETRSGARNGEHSRVDRPPRA